MRITTLSKFKGRRPPGPPPLLRTTGREGGEGGRREGWLMEATAIAGMLTIERYIDNDDLAKMIKLKQQEGFYLEGRHSLPSS
jgi:hypothetical protein